MRHAILRAARGAAAGIVATIPMSAVMFIAQRLGPVDELEDVGTAGLGVGDGTHARPLPGSGRTTRSSTAADHRVREPPRLRGTRPAEEPP